MQTIADAMKLGALRAAGTSEGVKKAWDTRGRKTKSVVESHPGWEHRPDESTKSTHVYRQSGYKGHTLSVSHDGSWHRSDENSNTIAHGDNAFDLKKHLEK